MPRPWPPMSTACRTRRIPATSTPSCRPEAAPRGMRHDRADHTLAEPARADAPRRDDGRPRSRRGLALPGTSLRRRRSRRDGGQPQRAGAVRREGQHRADLHLAAAALLAHPGGPPRLHRHDRGGPVGAGLHELRHVGRPRVRGAGAPLHLLRNAGALANRLHLSSFWRPNTVPVRVGDRVEQGFHVVQLWVRFRERAEEVLVFYPPDGYWRARPLPPPHMRWSAYGSSFLVGRWRCRSAPSWR